MKVKPENGVRNVEELISSPVTTCWTTTSPRVSRREMPIVATVAMSRGAWRNRRISAVSTKAPRPIATPNSSGRVSQ